MWQQIAAIKNTIAVTHRSGFTKPGSMNSIVNQKKIAKQNGIRAPGISLCSLAVPFRWAAIHDLMKNLKHRTTIQKIMKLARWIAGTSADSVGRRIAKVRLIRVG
jgi:hypothetical protein